MLLTSRHQAKFEDSFRGAAAADAVLDVLGGDVELRSLSILKVFSILKIFEGDWRVKA